MVWFMAYECTMSRRFARIFQSVLLESLSQEVDSICQQSCSSDNKNGFAYALFGCADELFTLLRSQVGDRLSHLAKVSLSLLHEDWAQQVLLIEVLEQSLHLGKICGCSCYVALRQIAVDELRLKPHRGRTNFLRFALTTPWLSVLLSVDVTEWLHFLIEEIYSLN